MWDRVTGLYARCLEMGWGACLGLKPGIKKLRRGMGGVGMACGARLGLKLVAHSEVYGSPIVVGMACGARLGLKHGARKHIDPHEQVGMACGARLGLKHGSRKHSDH